MDNTNEAVDAEIGGALDPSDPEFEYQVVANELAPAFQYTFGRLELAQAEYLRRRHPKAFRARESCHHVRRESFDVARDIATRSVVLERESSRMKIATMKVRQGITFVLALIGGWLAGEFL